MFILNLKACLLLQTEVVTRGRAYSDDEEEDEELGHDRRSELMATELARRTTKSEPAYRAFGLMKKKVGA